jgi:hypothetical protein
MLERVELDIPELGYNAIKITFPARSVDRVRHWRWYASTTIRTVKLRPLYSSPSARGLYQIEGIVDHEP